MIPNGRFQALRILIMAFILLIFCSVYILKSLCYIFFYLQPNKRFHQPSTPHRKADWVYELSILSMCLLSAVL